MPWIEHRNKLQMKCFTTILVMYNIIELEDSAHTLGENRT